MGLPVLFRSCTSLSCSARASCHLLRLSHRLADALGRGKLLCVYIPAAHPRTREDSRTAISPAHWAIFLLLISATGRTAGRPRLWLLGTMPSSFALLGSLLLFSPCPCFGCLLAAVW